MTDREVIEQTAQVLDSHQIVWIGHKEGWDCGCNERGTLPPMPHLTDALRHQAKALADVGVLREPMEGR